MLCADINLHVMLPKLHVGFLVILSISWINVMCLVVTDSRWYRCVIWAQQKLTVACNCRLF